MHTLTIVWPNESSTITKDLTAEEAMVMEAYWKSRGILCFISSEC